MVALFNSIKNILLISGLDPSSGAGLTQDIKTATKLEAHITCVPTCLSVQNSQKFQSINTVNIDIFLKQIKAVTDDIKIDFIKIGLLPNKDLIFAIHELLEGSLNNIPIILDPVISSTTGKKILAELEIEILKKHLFSKCYLITPNIIEAEILSNIKINNINDIKRSAQILQKMGAQNILIKGGHFQENKDKITHFLLKKDNSEKIFQNKRIITSLEVRGTGCMLATAISCFLAKEFTLENSIKKANKFVSQEIGKAKKIGQKLLMI